MDDWTVRFIEEQDEDQVVELHRRAFPHDRRTIEHQHWKYTANPFGEPIRVGAFASDGTLATHVSAYAIPMVQAGPGERRTLRAQQIGDSMTDPRFRRVGHGHGGLFARAMQRLVNAGGERGMDVVYGVAPARLQRFYVRNIRGSERLLDIPFRLGAVRDGRLVDAASTAVSGYTIRALGDDATALDTLFDRVAPAHGILVRRDAAYLAWRYESCPDRDYLVAVAERDETIVGWSAFRRDGEDLVWGDSLFEPEHAAAARPLLDWALERIPGIVRLRAWFRDRPARWAKEIESLGLDRAPEPHDQSVISACFARPGAYPGLTGDDLRRDLYLTMGDSDLF